MKIRTTFVVMIAALAFGAPVAAADPDTYPSQPQASVQPDAIDRYLRNAKLSAAGQPDALDRYLRNHQSGAATHLDSHDFRPTTSGSVAPAADEGRDWMQGGLVALGGGFVLLLAVVGASATRERRRPILR